MNENFTDEKVFRIIKFSDLMNEPLKYYQKLEKSNSYLYQTFLLNSENDDKELNNTFIINNNSNLVLKDELNAILSSILMDEVKSKYPEKIIKTIKAKLFKLILDYNKKYIFEENFQLNFICNNSQPVNTNKSNFVETKRIKEKNKENNPLYNYISAISEDKEENNLEKILKMKMEKPKKKTANNSFNNPENNKRKDNINFIKNSNNNQNKKINYECKQYQKMSLEELQKENESIKIKIRDLNERNKDSRKKDDDLKKLKALTNKWKRIAQDACYNMLSNFPNNQDGKRNTLKNVIQAFKVDFQKLDYDEENDEFLNY